MNDWKEQRLGQVLDLYDSQRIPLSSLERESIQGAFPYYGASGIIDHLNNYIFDGDYLLIAEDGENLNSRKLPVAFWARGKFWVNNHAHVVRGKSGQAHTDFVRYCFASGDISGFITGSAQPKLSQANLKKITFRFPCLPVQKKIAAVLSAYDELIENNQRRIALLEKLAEEIYREWFVRLRFPGHEKMKKIKGVPEGWADQKFGQFCQLQRGFDLTDAQIEPGPYPVVASTSIKAWHSQYKVEPPVIVTGRSGSLGEVQFVNSKAWPHNTTLYVKQFFANSPFLIFYTLKNMRLENFNAGAGVPTLNRNHLNGIPLVVPDKPLQKRFDELVSPLHAQAELLLAANGKLAATRDLLLPRLISGKLSVEELDIQAPPGMVEGKP